MRHPAEELLIALSHGLEGWMLDSTVDAVEIASFVHTTGNPYIPGNPEAIERLLSDMVDSGLVERRSKPPSEGRGGQGFGAYALTETGWSRARELEGT